MTYTYTYTYTPRHRLTKTTHTDRTIHHVTISATISYDHGGNRHANVPLSLILLMVRLTHTHIISPCKRPKAAPLTTALYPSSTHHELLILSTLLTTPAISCPCKRLFMILDPTPVVLVTMNGSPRIDDDDDDDDDDTITN